MEKHKDELSDEYLKELEEKYGKPKPDPNSLFSEVKDKREEETQELIEKPKKKKNAFKVVVGIFVVIGLLLVGGVIWWQFFYSSYTKAENWAYYGTDDDKDVDVFLVHVFNNSEQAKSIDSDKAYKNLISEKIPMYEGFCSIYAPYYSLNAGNPYSGRTYREIKRAFATYMREKNNGKPVILAGYNAGGEIVLRLLEDFFQGEERQNQLIAAYVIDWEVESKYTDKNGSIQQAKGNADVGVIVNHEESITARVESYFRNSVTTQAQFVEALGGLDYASARDGVITLKQDIQLEKTIIIAEGTYTILGNGHTITRSSTADMFSLAGVEDSKLKLILGKNDGSDILILDGNREAFSDVNGAIIGLYGEAELDIYAGVSLQNNSRKGYPGGAVYGECSYVDNGNNTFTCLEPTINVFGATFSNNSTDQNGGALALIGSYSSSEEKYFGYLNIYNGIFENNTAQNGTSLYCKSGTCSYAQELGFEDSSLYIVD